MTREFKFNVWDVENKRMFKNAFKLTNEGTSSWNQFTNDSSENLIWLQFIGLKDKNGTEIYEGDKLQIKTSAGRTEVFTVVYDIHRRETKIGFTVDIPSFAFVNSEGFPTYPIVDNYLNGHDLEIIEVIGHIYQ